MVTEKYAIPDDLDKIIGSYEEEKERGHNADAENLSGSDIKTTQKHSDRRREKHISISSAASPQ
jgi:hypothetical protein